MMPNCSTLARMLRHSNRSRAVCVLATLGILAGGGEAAAQSDGVVVDPDSPAGKEYALPLDKARQDVAPTPGAGTDGSDETNGSNETPLFGAGITKRDGGQGGQGDGRDRGDGGAQGDGGGSGGNGGDVANGSVTATAAASGSGLSSGWITALVAFGVLLVGGIVGLSLRALRSSEPD
jgi:hypothetical protein